VLNGGPDALSRNPVEDASESPIIDLVSVIDKPDDVWYNSTYDSVVKTPELFENYKVEGNQLFKSVDIRGATTWVRVIPPELRETVLRESHDLPVAGHFGAKKTFEKVKELYYWPKMKKACVEYVKKCAVCKANKSSQLKRMGFMGKHREVSSPMEVVSSDLIGPLPRSSSGFQFVIVSVCLFSKYVWVRPLRNQTSQGVANHLENDIFLKYGAP